MIERLLVADGAWLCQASLGVGTVSPGPTRCFAVIAGEIALPLSPKRTRQACTKLSPLVHASIVSIEPSCVVGSAHRVELAIVAVRFHADVTFGARLRAVVQSPHMQKLIEHAFRGRRSRK